MAELQPIIVFRSRHLSAILQIVLGLRQTSTADVGCRFTQLSEKDYVFTLING